MRERRVILAVVASAAVGVLAGFLVHDAMTPACRSCPTAPASDPGSASAGRSIPRGTTPGTIDAARARDPSTDVLREQVAALEQEVASLEAENELLTEQALAGDPRHYGFSERELEVLARNCEVRSDSAPTVITDAFLDAVKAKPEERAILERVAAEFEAAEATRKRALLVEAGADMAEYDRLEGLDREIFFATQIRSERPDAQWEVQRSMAEERAGLREPITAAELAAEDLHARYLRGHLSTGDRFAEALAVELGEARVHELRAARGGWTGGGVRYSGCPED